MIVATRSPAGMALLACLAMACSDKKPSSTVPSPATQTCGDGICDANEAAGDPAYEICAADCAMVDVSLGRTHACAVRKDGRVFCWGGREGHRLGGLGDVNTPVEVPGVTDAVAVAAGEFHTCVLLGDGTAACWGHNGLGETGSGAIERDVFPPEPVEGLTGIESITAGMAHTCARTDAGEVYCWGASDFGQVGGGEFRLINSTPVHVGTAAAVSAGNRHTCLLRTNEIDCFGAGLHGRLGTGTFLWWNTPTPVIVDRDWAAAAQAIAAGSAHACARIGLTPGDAPFVACWGWNGSNALGVEGGSGPLLAVAVPGFTPEMGAGRSPMAAGNNHTCAVSATDGDVYCWGSNQYGELGIGNTDPAPAGPHRIDGVHGATVIAARWFMTCAIAEGGVLSCWGDNRMGQLGNGSADPESALPVIPAGL